MRRRIAGLAALLLLASPAARADDGAAMHAAADGFYGVYQALHPSGVPGDAVRARFAPFISPTLETLLQQAGGAEERFATANKDSPPLAEGDLFSSLFEGATGFVVGACGGDGHSGHCAVALTYADPGNKPTVWTDTVYLLHTPDGWRVDDIAYGGAWAFGNKGRLSETLKQIIGFQ
jgi:hypothetical protein